MRMMSQSVLEDCEHGLRWQEAGFAEMCHFLRCTGLVTNTSNVFVGNGGESLEQETRMVVLLSGTGSLRK